MLLSEADSEGNGDKHRYKQISGIQHTRAAINCTSCSESVVINLSSSPGTVLSNDENTLCS